MRRSSVVAGLILICVGLFFLLLPFFPNVTGFINIERHWPMIVVGVGLLFLLGAIIGTPQLAVPGSIIAGIGAIMYFQNLNNSWGSWAYAWALIPGFVGLGTIIMNLLQGEGRKSFRDGGQLVIISLVLFFVFGSIMGAGFGSSVIWAVLFIGLGLWLFVRALTRNGKKEQ